jgi:hypothetical protein
VRRNRSTGLGSDSPCARNSCCSLRRRLRRGHLHGRRRRAARRLNAGENEPPTGPW